MKGVRLISQSEVRIEWTDINTRLRRRPPKSASVRSSGVHLSGVIRYALKTAQLLKTEDETDEMPLRMAVGMAWEDWVVGLYPDMDWQPGEWEKDHVYGTPDGASEILICGRCGAYVYPTMGCSECRHCDRILTELCVDEFKATWKSRRTHEPVTNELIWMWQLAANCLAMRTNYARLHVLWVNGAYPKGAPSPVYMTYLIGFEQKALEDFWNNVIVPNRDKAPREEHD